jgi:hypothetical protein
MTTSQSIIVAVMAVVGIVGSVLGLIAFIGAERSLLHGSMIVKLASDDDLHPHPRLRHH